MPLDAGFPFLQTVIQTYQAAAGLMKRLMSKTNKEAVGISCGMTGAFALFAKWFGAKIKIVIARKCTID